MCGGNGGLKGVGNRCENLVVWAATVSCNNNTKEKDTEFKVILHDAKEERWFVLEKKIASPMGIIGDFAVFVASYPFQMTPISPCFLGFFGRLGSLAPRLTFRSTNVEYPWLHQPAARFLGTPRGIS